MDNCKFLKPKDLRKIFVDSSDSTFIKWVEAGLINKYKVKGSVFYKELEVIQMIRMCKEGFKTTHKINLEEDKFIRGKHLKNYLDISNSSIKTLVLDGLLNRYKIGGGVYYLKSDILKLPKVCRRF